MQRNRLLIEAYWSAQCCRFHLLDDRWIM